MPSGKRALHAGLQYALTLAIAVLFISGVKILLFDQYGFNIVELLQKNGGKHDMSTGLLFSNSKKYVSSSHMICFIARVYDQTIGYLLVLALGLHHTGLDNIHILILNTDRRTNMKRLMETIKLINELALRSDYAILVDVGMPSAKNDYGFGVTDRILAYLYKQNRRSPLTCEYVVLTNADNFYSQSFGMKILPHINAKKDIIGWGFISRYYWPQSTSHINNKKQSIPQVVDDGTQRCMKVAFVTGAVDLGAVAYRLEFLRQYNLYFRGRNETYTSLSDG
ncbi:unnamed protein product, partial [Adineta steineri]